MTRTADGIAFSDIFRVAIEAGAEIRQGSKHPYCLQHPEMRPCPIARSTHARNMVAGWLAEISGRKKQEAYQAMRKGYWQN